MIDVICAVMGLNGNNAAMTFARLKDEHPDLTTICGQVKFTDCKGRKGNRGTPVIDVRGIVLGELLNPKNTTIVNNCNLKLTLFDGQEAQERSFEDDPGANFCTLNIGQAVWSEAPLTWGPW